MGGKLKVIKYKAEDSDGLIDSKDIVMNNDKSGLYVVVNEEESNNRDELDTASSTNSDLEVEEK